MNKPVEFLPISPETPPVFPCWAFDYEWKMVYRGGHLLDQHTHWAPGGCEAPSISPNSKSPAATPRETLETRHEWHPVATSETVEKRLKTLINRLRLSDLEYDADIAEFEILPYFQAADRDRERLDWMIANRAHVTHHADGKFDVWFPSRCYEQARGVTARDAIDKAMLPTPPASDMEAPK